MHLNFADVEKPIPTANEIFAKACAVAFGRPLVENSYRGLVAEIIIGAALGPEWKWRAGDWRGWEFERLNGCRLEVKQSAARQTWAAPKPRRATRVRLPLHYRLGGRQARVENEYLPSG